MQLRKILIDATLISSLVREPGVLYVAYVGDVPKELSTLCLNRSCGCACSSVVVDDPDAEHFFTCPRCERSFSVAHGVVKE